MLLPPPKPAFRHQAGCFRLMPLTFGFSPFQRGKPSSPYSNPLGAHPPSPRDLGSVAVTAPPQLGFLKAARAEVLSIEELIEALDKVGMYTLPSALSYFLSLPFPPSSRGITGLRDLPCPQGVPGINTTWACGIASLCVIVWDSRVTVWVGQHLLTAKRSALSKTRPLPRRAY